MVCLSKLLSPPHLVSVSDRLFLILRNILTIFIYSTGDVLMSNSFQCWLYHKVYNGLSVLSPFVGIFWRKLTEVYLRERRHCLTKVKCFLTSLILKLWWRWWGWWWWCWWSPSWWWRWWGSGWEWCWWWWWWSPSTNFMHKQWIFCIKIQNMPRTSPNDFSFRLVEATLLLLLSWVQLVGLREAWQDLARSWED